VLASVYITVNLARSRVGNSQTEVWERGHLPVEVGDGVHVRESRAKKKLGKVWWWRAIQWR
jgi:hypothetical protein